MVVPSRLRVVRSRFFLGTVAGGNVHFAPNDRLNPCSHCPAVKFHGSEQIPMVGHGNCRHSCRLRFLDQIRDFVRPVEQRILGVNVQMNEAHLSATLPG
ncbi:hypothetical protein HRbin30_02068 [bacterium HR30]|nr:hypothetical protein HRbin30_02068 [bacterium HR30]